MNWWQALQFDWDINGATDGIEFMKTCFAMPFFALICGALIGVSCRLVDRLKATKEH